MTKIVWCCVCVEVYSTATKRDNAHETELALLRAATAEHDVPMSSSRSPAPAWFTRAVAAPHRTTVVASAGVDVNVLSWGDPAAPGVVLIHGGAAHAHWWSFIAPQLSVDHHVAAIDLTGHGDSGRREHYELEAWAEEVVAVAEALGMDQPILVGHSMGGFVAIVAASLHGDRFPGTIIVDSPVRRADPETDEAARGRAFSNPKTYPSIGEAVRHFHLVPPQPCDNAYVVDHVATHSLRQVDGGWTWKFDPEVFRRFSDRPTPEYLAEIQGRVAVLHGEFSSIVTPDVIDHMDSLLGRTAPFVEIPQAHHHLILDQPLAFIAAVRALLADWSQSVPRRGRTELRA